MPAQAFATLAALPRAGVNPISLASSSSSSAERRPATASIARTRFTAASSKSEFVGVRVRSAAPLQAAAAPRSFQISAKRVEITQVGDNRPADHPCNQDPQKRKAEQLYLSIQHKIVSAFEDIDGSGDYRVDKWERKTGGGGVTMVKQNGNVFEKSGIAVSCVHGKMSPSAFGQATGDGDVSRRAPDAAPKFEGDIPFFACGVSSVNHPWNPHAPTMHFNYRYFEAGGSDGQPKLWWFGGGADLTPSYLYEEDAVHFHQKHKDACDKHDPTLYPKFKAWCDEYFLIKHRGEMRGIGGIIFDDWNDRSQDEIMSVQRDCADALIEAYIPLLQKRKDQPFTEAEKDWQQLRRGRYVEYNLIYDRGTAFGLKTGGRTESILMSMPLTARWEYDHAPEPGSREADLLDACKNPRDWLKVLA